MSSLKSHGIDTILKRNLRNVELDVLVLETGTCGKLPRA